ncbi:hypothetical protein IVB14_16330 [Bradyrhizobium sp. 180]|uniref:hypothetical protein n=1 Tax=Bradyrhizobium sp. 180 TaxID=2782650 RepID=UPI001FFA7E2C|nr:hypothetical protein [Bradyrhizobium sp. 180]MCK1491946.1 hypothetical protein [Bradyrhizobium sp. 180]
MAHKMKASQFTYAAHGSVTVIDQTNIEVRAGTDRPMPMTDRSACQPPAASSLRLTRAKKSMRLRRH